MNEVLRKLIEEQFGEEIYDYLKDHIRNNYGCYNFAIKSRSIKDVFEAMVNNMQIFKISNIKQFHREVDFDLCVNCNIEISGITYDEYVYENICEILNLRCSVILENAALSQFTIKDVQASNKVGLAIEWI